MTKTEFLRRLKKALAPLDAKERQAALQYWEEYIAEAAAQCDEEETIEKMDAPEEIARKLLAESAVGRERRKKRSAGYWALVVMASPIYLALGAAALATVLCVALALALLAILPALVALILLVSGLCSMALGFTVLRDGATFAFIAGIGLVAFGGGGLLSCVAFPLLPRVFSWFGRHIRFHRRKKA